MTSGTVVSRKQQMTFKQNYTLNYELPQLRTFGTGHLPKLTVNIYDSKRTAINETISQLTKTPYQEL